MEDNKMKELVFKFLNMMGKPEEISGEAYNIYQFGKHPNDIAIGVEKNDTNNILLAKLPTYIQKFIPIEYGQLRGYIAEWVKEKYVNGR